MDLKLVPFLHLIVFTTSIKSRDPQVYEDVDETPLGFSKIIKESSQRFSFSGAAQMDQQRWRYHQQQQMDALNRSKNKYVLQRPKPKRIPNLRKREIQIQDRNLKPQAIVLGQKNPLNFGLDHAENLKLLHESFGGSQQQLQERDIQALSALIGQAPTAQLEGLKQLLGPNDHKPIIEHVVDVVNPQVRPNIKVEPAPLEYQQAVAQAHAFQADAQKRLKQQNLLALAHIEKELNAVAQAQAQETLAKAQRAALAEVEAQQQALVIAQAQAEKAAIEQVQAQAALYGQDQAEKAAINQVEAQALYGHAPRVVQYQPVVRHQNVEDSKKAYGGSNDDLQYASQYAFGYRVRDYHSGNNFGHEEISDGKTAKGHYHVLLPDGRLQNVQYWADETGFHAKVTYDRLAQH